MTKKQRTDSPSNPSRPQAWTEKVLAAGESSVAHLRMRLDSWANALTGLNTARDKTSYTLPYVDQLLNPQMLEVLYHNDDIAARIVSAVPDEAFREAWTILNKGPGSGEGEDLRAQASLLEADFENFSVRQKMRESLTWGRLYGTGAIYMDVDDGRETWEPIDWDNIRSVNALTVLDKRDLTPWRWYADLEAPKFGDVAIYQIQPVGVFVGAPYDLNATNQIILTHESRLIRFGGELTSKRERLRNQGADYSVLQKCFRALQLTNNNWQSASVLLADASQGVFKITGLVDMISQQPDVMNTRMQLVDQLRSVVRGIVLDKDSEDFTRVPSQFAGIPDMLEQTWNRLAAAARMPLTVLMGTSPAGMNATGESDIRWWYDQIAATQREVILPELNRLLRIFACAHRFQNTQNWTVQFAPLWQMKQSERAEYELKIAQKDQIYMAAGVLLPEEVALSRFGNGQYSEQTTIDVPSRKRKLIVTLEMQRLKAELDAENAKNPMPPQEVMVPGGFEPGAPAPDRAHPTTPDGRPPNAVEA